MPQTHPRPRFEDRIDLVALPSAVTVARLFVSRTLRRWGARFAEAEMVSLAAELVALAVDETGPGRDPTTGPLLDPIEVHLAGYDRHLLVQVMHVHHPELPSGVRGELAVVNALARAWGAYPTSSQRIVWAELDLPGRGVPQRSRKLAASCLRDLGRSGRPSPR
jgi:hypothetical protein